MAAGFGPKESPAREPLSISRCQLKRTPPMNPLQVEVLLIEDNPRDAEMTLRTLRKRNLANNVIHIKDGQEALDWLFGRGAFAGRDPCQHPSVTLLDLKLPKVDGLEVLRAIRAD